MTAILIITLFILFFLSVPIAIALGISSSVAIIFAGGIPLSSIAQKLFTSIDSFPLMAIPFFIMAGTVMEVGGISKRLINFASSLVGPMHGGLGIVVVVTSLFFAAISGSGIATTAALGSILIPAMIQKGYDRSFAGSIQAISGELGVIIPPSISLILFGVAAQVSIGDLFIAGILPGLMIALSLMIVVYIISRKRGYQGTGRFSMAERFAALKDASLALLMPIIILGGIYGGIFTPTEASAVAVAYSLIVALFIYKEINIKEIIPLFVKSMSTTAIVMFIIANAGLFGWILTRQQVPHLVAEFFVGLSSSPLIFLLIINLLLFVVGMFFDGNAAIIILAPILTPVALSLGIDPIHFGIIMVVNLAMGMCTPPLGVNLFVSCRIANIRLEQISLAILPFLAVIVVNVLILSYIPQISLYLVNLLSN